MKKDLINEIINSVYGTKNNILNKEEEIVLLSKKISKQILNDKRVVIFGTGIASEIIDQLTKTLWTSFKISKEQITSFVINKPQEMNEWKSVDWHESIIVVDMLNINLKKTDLVIGVSTNGLNSYVERGLKFAKDLKCDTAIISGKTRANYKEYVNLIIDIENNKQVFWALKGQIESPIIIMIIFDAIIYQALSEAGRIYKKHLPFLNPISEDLYIMCIKTIMELTKLKKVDAIAKMEENYNKLENTLIAITYNVGFKETEKILKLNKNNFNIIMDPKKIVKSPKCTSKKSNNK